MREVIGVILACLAGGLVVATIIPPLLAPFLMMILKVF